MILLITAARVGIVRRVVVFVGLRASRSPLLVDVGMV